MKKKRLIRCLLFAQFLCFATSQFVVAQDASSALEKPDIVLILIDSLRPDHLGCYGYHRDTSPNIDAFAKGAVLFKQAVASGPWTQPAIMSMMSSVEPGTHQRFDWTKPHNPDITTLAEVLRVAGYQTVGLTSNPMTNRKFGFGKGFDFYDDYTVALSPDVSSEVSAAQAPSGVTMTRLASDWLTRKRDPAKPLFLFVLYMDAHWDYIPPAPYDALFAEDSVPAQRNIFAFKGLPTEIAKRRVIAAYDGEIAYADNCVSNLLATVSAGARGDNTAVVICADHGESFWERGVAAHGNNLHDEELMVPLIIRAPNESKGRVVEQQVGLIDLAPTLAALAGAALPEAWQGADLAPLMRGEEMPEKPITLDLRINKHYIRGERTSKKKTVWAIGNPDEPIAVYDLIADPKETRNLVGE